MTEPIDGFVPESVDVYNRETGEIETLTEPTNHCASCGRSDEDAETRLSRIETMAFATGQQVDWLVNQLAGMFQAAANMPGLGGMMMRKMTGGN